MLVQYINQIFDGKALSSKMISEALELITSGTVPAVALNNSGKCRSLIPPITENGTGKSPPQLRTASRPKS